MLICTASAHTLKNKGYILINQVLQGGFLILLNMLIQYAHLIENDMRYILLYIAGSVCLILYTVYVSLYAFRQMLQEKREIKEKKQRSVKKPKRHRRKNGRMDKA